MPYRLIDRNKHPWLWHMALYAQIIAMAMPVALFVTTAIYLIIHFVVTPARISDAQIDWITPSLLPLKPDQLETAEKWAKAHNIKYTINPDGRFFIPNDSTIPVGWFVHVSSTVRRYQSCTIDSSRIIASTAPLKNGNLATETVLQSQEITFTSDPIPQRVGFFARINIGVSPGEYYLYSRSRFFCDPFDYLPPGRSESMPKLRINVVEAPYAPRF